MAALVAPVAGTSECRIRRLDGSGCCCVTIDTEECGPHVGQGEIALRDELMAQQVFEWEAVEELRHEVFFGDLLAREVERSDAIDAVVVGVTPAIIVGIAFVGLLSGAV